MSEETQTPEVTLPVEVPACPHCDGTGKAKPRVLCQWQPICLARPRKGDYCENHVCDVPACANPRDGTCHLCQEHRP